MEQIVSHIDPTGTIEGAPYLKPEHLPVFDCSFRPPNGVASIHYMGHVRMMAAVQPFISGAISKTINMPEECHGGGHHERLHRELEAGTEGRSDLPRQFQARAAAQLRIGKGEKKAARRDASEAMQPVEKVVYRPVRRKLPDERAPSRTSSRSAATKATSPSGMYEDGAPGEIFITMAKEGSTISGLMDASPPRSASTCSTACRSSSWWTNSRTCGSSPAAGPGTSRSPTPSRSWITSSGGSARSSWDRSTPISEAGETPTLRPTESRSAAGTAVQAGDGRRTAVPECGSIMTRNGSCYKCGNAAGPAAAANPVLTICSGRIAFRTLPASIVCPGAFFVG